MDSQANSEVDLLRTLGLGSNSTLVEFGVGTGQLAIAAAPHCAHVMAVDVSPAMLSLLRTKLDDAGLGNVTIVESGFLSFPFQPSSVDFIYSRFALHHLPDFWKSLALQRIYEMLTPGGVFRLWDVIYNFDPHEAADRLEDWCATGQDVSPFTPIEDDWGRWEIAEHVRDEHSTYSWLLEAMFDRIGFSIEHAEKPDATTAQYVLRKR